MEKQMFCFQCEQTVGCQGCTGPMGACGKRAGTAALQDKLTGALIGLARATEGNEVLISSATDHVVREGLYATMTNVNFTDECLERLIGRVELEKRQLIPRCYVCESGCSRNENYDMEKLWSAEADIRSMKSLLLFGIRGMAAYAYHAAALGYTNREVDAFFYKALMAVGEDYTPDDLLPLVMEVGQVNLTCMELLDRAHTETYGDPLPTAVSLTVEKGPFIVVSGHDLQDLARLLAQTEGRGINIYTHGEMLPAHAYPGLNKYAHLKGHLGTAWHNQQKEFDGIPAPILFTSNCLMPPKESYADRVFSTELVSYPETVHLGGDKDFSLVIQRALELGGYEEDRHFTGSNGGDKVMCGFGRHAVLSVADVVVDRVQHGDIQHFFLVGGCDGPRAGRSYYTEFVKQTPPDSVVLTLACGKFRFNDLDLGTVGGLPRLMDVGQCNDAYAAIRIAMALAAGLGCGVNELPLHMVLSWYEQKAVCILLTLLHLGIQNIRLGPTLPAFLSPGVLDFLVEQFHIAPITTPAADLAQMLG